MASSSAELPPTPPPTPSPPPAPSTSTGKERVVPERDTDDEENLAQGLEGRAARENAEVNGSQGGHVNATTRYTSLAMMSACVVVREVLDVHECFHRSPAPRRCYRKTLLRKSAMLEVTEQGLAQIRSVDITGPLPDV
jgi:hypothetical protein